MDNLDIFVQNRIYPKAENIFSNSITSIENVKNECIYVIDTNALLIPYKIGSKSFVEIKNVYTKLKSENRIRIPAQVAREYAKQRPERIKELFQRLENNKTSKISLGKYPLLEDFDEFKSAIKIEGEINKLLNDYKKSISNLMDKISNWTWNDPVSELYNSLFNNNVVVDISLEEKEIKTELDYRYLHRIPPGYKDKRKKDDGIGDLLIWLTILEISKEGKHVIFVSGEEKSDWFYKSAGRVLYPRYELLDEFYRKSNSKSFHIIEFSEFITQYVNDTDIVKEIEEIERNKTSVPIEDLTSWENEIYELVLKLPTDVFHLTDLYSYEKELQEKHPNNKHIKAKVRQQLQFLRDKGYIQFLSNGKYKIIS